MNTEIQDKGHLPAMSIVEWIAAFFSVLLARRPPGVVTSTKTGNSAILKNLFLRNKANFNNRKLTVTTCSMGTYNDSQTKTKNGTNPNKANFRNANSPVFQKIKKMENEPNCNESDVTASNCYRKSYNGFYLKNQKGNEPKTNPIKANPNPISDSKPIIYSLLSTLSGQRPAVLISWRISLQEPIILTNA